LIVKEFDKKYYSVISEIILLFLRIAIFIV